MSLATSSGAGVDQLAVHRLGVTVGIRSLIVDQDPNLDALGKLLVQDRSQFGADFARVPPEHDDVDRRLGVPDVVEDARVELAALRPRLDRRRRAPCVVEVDIARPWRAVHELLGRRLCLFGCDRIRRRRPAALLGDEQHPEEDQEDQDGGARPRARPTPPAATRSSTRPIARRAHRAHGGSPCRRSQQRVASPPINVSHQPQARSDPGGGASPRTNSSTAIPQMQRHHDGGPRSTSQWLDGGDRCRARRGQRASRRVSPRDHPGGPARRPTTEPRTRTRSSRSRSVATPGHVLDARSHAPRPPLPRVPCIGCRGVETRSSLGGRPRRVDGSSPISCGSASVSGMPER